MLVNYGEIVRGRFKRAEQNRAEIETGATSAPHAPAVHFCCPPGRKDFLWHSVLYRGGNSLLLKVLLCVTSALWWVWESLSQMLPNLSSILQYGTTKESSCATCAQPIFPCWCSLQLQSHHRTSWIGKTWSCIWSRGCRQWTESLTWPSPVEPPCCSPKCQIWSPTV